jgi:predicted aspartyl protease
VVFWQRSGCANVAPDWPAPYATKPLARGAGNLVTLEVTINGHPVRAVLDTGAQNTILGFDAATRLGINAQSLAGSRVPVMRGSDGNDVFTRIAHVSDIAVGGAHRTNATILVAPLHLQYADMLLGVDFLQHRDVWISYGRQIAFFR